LSVVTLAEMAATGVAESPSNSTGHLLRMLRDRLMFTAGTVASSDETLAMELRRAAESTDGLLQAIDDRASEGTIASQVDIWLTALEEPVAVCEELKIEL
jgi:hypothetical protein